MLLKNGNSGLHRTYKSWNEFLTQRCVLVDSFPGYELYGFNSYLFYVADEKYVYKHNELSSVVQWNKITGKSLPEIERICKEKGFYVGIVNSESDF